MTIRGFVAGGRLELDVPAAWPDGMEVEIQPVAADEAETISAEEIARTLAAMDAVEPFEMLGKQMSRLAKLP